MSAANDTLRWELERKHGRVWDTAEMTKDFTVLGFYAYYCVVVRKSDGVKGSLDFTHSPRFYYKFVPA